MRGRYPEILTDPMKGEEARKLLAEAQAMLDKLIAGTPLLSPNAHQTPAGLTANAVSGSFGPIAWATTSSSMRMIAARPS